MEISYVKISYHDKLLMQAYRENKKKSETVISLLQITPKKNQILHNKINKILVEPLKSKTPPPKKTHTKKNYAHFYTTLVFGT